MLLIPADVEALSIVGSYGHLSCGVTSATVAAACSPWVPPLLWLWATLVMLVSSSSEGQAQRVLDETHHTRDKAESTAVMSRSPGVSSLLL